MQKRSSKTQKGRDANVTAFAAVQQATAEDPNPHRVKNPAAVALGQLGGLKGGPARAKNLTAKERSDIARVAAEARWKKADS